MTEFMNHLVPGDAGDAKAEVCSREAYICLTHICVEYLQGFAYNTCKWCTLNDIRNDRTMLKLGNSMAVHPCRQTNTIIALFFPCQFAIK